MNFYILMPQTWMSVNPAKKVKTPAPSSRTASTTPVASSVNARKDSIAKMAAVCASVTRATHWTGGTTVSVCARNIKFLCY